MREDDPVVRFLCLTKDALDARGMELDKCRALRGPLRRAGFTNIELLKKKVPIGSWCEQDESLKHAGNLQKLSLQNVVPVVTGRLFQEIGISLLEREVWSATVKKSLTDASVHRYFNVYFWTAQKPSS